MRTRTYSSEFPGFVLDVPLPEGFTDISWHNDVAPSFFKPLPSGRGLRLWIDFANVAQREDQATPRFGLTLQDTEGFYQSDMVMSDDYGVMLAFINNYKEETTP